jgi:hypothetical protein
MGSKFRLGDLYGAPAIYPEETKIEGGWKDKCHITNCERKPEYLVKAVVPGSKEDGMLVQYCKECWEEGHHTYWSKFIELKRRYV